MRITNPYKDIPYERVAKDRFGNDEYGYRTVDGVEEIVHLPTDRSNMEYHVPEVVTHYDNCEHVFRVVNMGIREVECTNVQCRLLTSFHPAVNFKEVDGKAFIILNRREYPLIS